MEKSIQNLLDLMQEHFAALWQQTECLYNISSHIPQQNKKGCDIERNRA